MIVPQQSIADVHLLMSAPGVRRALGAPKSTKTLKDEIQGTIRLMDYGKTKVYLSATADGTVFSIMTTDRRQKTATGVGVGSTERALKRGVKSLHCTAPGANRACTVGRELAGKRVTRFVLSGGRVRQIMLGFVID